MEKDNWIKKIINSTNEITTVSPAADLFSKIQTRINKQKVSSKTVLLVAASIAILVLINVAFLTTQSNKKKSTETVFFENTLNKSNQLYQ